MKGASAPWATFLQALHRAQQAPGPGRRGVALLDLTALADPLRRQGSEQESRRFLLAVLHRLREALSSEAQGYLLGGPLLGFLFTIPEDTAPPIWLADLQHRVLRSPIPGHSGDLPLKGRLVATRVHRAAMPSLILELLLEYLYHLPQEGWSWLAFPPPPSDWERFWAPRFEPWYQDLVRRRDVLWITGGSALDRTMVLDLLRRAWGRLGFPYLYASHECAYSGPYQALLAALERLAVGLPTVHQLAWRRLQTSKEPLTITQARQWLTHTLHTLGSTQPLLLMLPEFQQVDLETQHFLKHFLRNPGNVSVVITSAYPPEPGVRSQVNLQQLPDLQEMLHPAALGHLFPGLNYPDVVRWLLANPAYHRLHCLRVLYRLKGTQALEGISSKEPPVREVLSALSEPERRFLRKISLLQGPLDPDLLREITGLPEMDIGTLFHRLAALHILRHDGTGTFYFPTSFLKRHLAATLPAGEKQEIHRQVARWMETHPERFPAEALVPHLMGAGRYGRVLHVNLDLATSYFHRGAPLSALRALQRAAKLARFDPSLQETLSRRLNLQDLLPHPNTVEALPALLREAHALAEHLERAGDPENLFTLRTWMVRLLLHQGRYEEAYTLSQAVHQQAQETGDPQRLAQALELLGLTAWYRDQLDRAEDFWKQALVYAQEAQVSELLARLLGDLGMVYQRRHRYRLALRSYVSALRIYNRTGNRRAVATGLGMVGNVFRAWGHLGRALEYYRRAAHVSRQVGDTYHTVVWKAEEGFVYTDLALWEEGVPRLLEALALAHHIEATYLLANLQVEILWVQAQRGFRRRALEGFRRLIHRLQSRGITDLEMRARFYRVHLQMDLQDFAAATQDLQEIATEFLPRHPQFRDLVDLAWIRLLNATGRAREAMRRFSRWFEDLSGPVPSGTARLTIDAVRGETLVRAGDARAPEYLKEAWEHALRLARSLPTEEQARRFLARERRVQVLRRLREQAVRSSSM